MFKLKSIIFIIVIIISHSVFVNPIIAQTNVALHKRAWASSIEWSTPERESVAAGQAFDGDYTTRWSSEFSDPQWIMVDLGSIYPIHKVSLFWEMASGKAYSIEVSIDSLVWDEVFSTTEGGNNCYTNNEYGYSLYVCLDTLTFDLCQARYVRMFGRVRNTIFGYSLWEFEIYSDSNNTFVDNNDIQLQRFALQQNYPNPFNPKTTISFQIPKSSFVNLSVYNALGQRVETLVNEHKNAGSYTVDWNTDNVNAGIYFYRIQAGEFCSVKKCVVSK
jgi:hypothetical protein